ncbi:chemotaxis protein CheB [Pelotomaculum propionicicum]|uniref:chemotaxis protein CheB n=1 Tax=Pelotomaculum propionicicum TaxID=258475 RepID=UPI003B821EE1
MLTEIKSGHENKIAQEGEQQELPEDSTCEDAVAGGLTGDERSGNEPGAIVGIGASAGGLEAFTQLLENLPNDTGMAFVLVQHLDPSHKSILSEILSRSTSMPVSEVEDKTVLKPNCVYIIPPGKAMSVSQGILSLVPREDIARQYMPVDFFLESLAKDQGGKAIGVILSGTATDGSRGLKEIKNAGGITFAQKPQTARFDGMPLNAVAAGVVDFILTSEDIAGELVKIACSSAFEAVNAETGKLFSDGAIELKQIFTILRKACGTDFSLYRELTIKRRILRRMVLHRIEKLDEYVDCLRENPAEVEELYQDLLINVTNFFRDPEAFETLKSRVFPVVVKTRQPGDPVRVWVPGCSTGEEAYSIAILLIEFLGDDAVNTPIQIFATDTNETLIEKARSGIYPASIKADVAPERLRRFFTIVDKGYRISKTVRDMCVFARQDMVKDPPFSRLDLISCRNVIIYFGQAMQKKLFPVFHYALRQNGFLFLGSSESVGVYANLFNLEDKKHKIFSKKAVQTPIISELAAGEYMAAAVEQREKVSRISPDADLKFNVLEEANRIVLSQYAPAGVIVNSDLEIIQFRGRTGPYLEPASGTPSLNILKMARDGLSLGLHSAINQAKKENVPVRKEGLRVVYNGRSDRVNVDVIPFGEPRTKEKHFLILFEKTVPHDLTSREKTGSAAVKLRQAEVCDEDNQLIGLEHELAATKEYLKSAVEQYELTNEALRAANEEIQSSNEELQSMNEELETSKEELQSSNEELMTLNDEVQNRNLELGRISSDLQNLFRSVNIPVIMLGSNLNIRLFNHSAEKALNLIATDVGRPITDINTKFNNFELEQAILEVNDTLISKEQEVQDRHGCWYSVQIRPYRTLENKIDGVVITFVDISIIKKSLVLSQEARAYAEAIVETVREPLLVLDAGLHIKSANKAFYQSFMVTPEDTLDRSIFDLGNGQWNIPELRVLLEEILPNNMMFEDFNVDHEFPNIGHKKMLVNARRVVSVDNQTKLILMAIEDKNEHMR